MNEQNNHPEYLGDAVYATFNGYSIELRLNRHDAPVVVCLEPEVLNRLLEYRRLLQKQKTTGEPDEMFEGK